MKTAANSTKTTAAIATAKTKAKTTARKADKIYFAIQKAAGVIILVLFTAFALWAENPSPLFFALFVGLPLIFTRQKVLTIIVSEHNNKNTF